MESADQENYLEKLRELKTIYGEVGAADIEKIKKILPESSGEEQLLSQLERIILKNGLILTSLRVEKKEEIKGRAGVGQETVQQGEILPKEIGKLKIAMDIVGTDYAGIKHILRALENNLRIIDIVKLSFSPRENKTSLEAAAYYLK